MKKIESLQIESSVSLDSLVKSAKMGLREGERPISIFLSGSRVEGLARSESDYELFVYVDSPDSSVRREMKVPIDGSASHAEVTVFTWNDIEVLLEQLNSTLPLATPDTEDKKVAVLAENPDFVFAHRIVTGVSIDGGNAEFEKLQDAVPADLVTRSMREIYIAMCIFYLRDAFSFMKAERNELAAYMMREAIDTAYRILLGSYGVTSPASKWRLLYGARKLGELNPLHLGYIALISLFSVDDQGVHVYMEAGSRYIQSVLDVSDCVLRGVDVGGLEERVYLPEREKQCVEKIPFGWLRTRAGGYFLITPDRAYNLPFEDGVLWASVDNGKTKVELAKSCGLLPEEFEDAFLRLIASGLVREVV